MIRVFPALLLSILLVPPTSGQSAAELARKFPHHEVYEVAPGVVMSARFAPSGEVCAMKVEQSHFKKDAVDLRIGLELASIDQLLNRLVPGAERGEKEEGTLSSVITVTGPTTQKIDRYANVTVEVIWNAKARGKTLTQVGPAVMEIKWRNRSCS